MRIPDVMADAPGYVTDDLDCTALLCYKISIRIEIAVSLDMVEACIDPFFMEGFLESDMIECYFEVLIDISLIGKFWPVIQTEPLELVLLVHHRDPECARELITYIFRIRYQEGIGRTDICNLDLIICRPLIKEIQEIDPVTDPFVCHIVQVLLADHIPFCLDMIHTHNPAIHEGDTERTDNAIQETAHCRRLIGVEFRLAVL